jgi:hypothetical protein
MTKPDISRILMALLFCLLSGFDSYAFQNEGPIIFPIPSNIQIQEGKFNLDDSVFLLLPMKSNESDEFLGTFLRQEMADKYAHSLNSIHKITLPVKGKFILIGSIGNPLIKSYCERKALSVRLKKLGSEGYILSVSENEVVIAANTNSGALLGVESLRQIIHQENGNLFLPRLFVEDAPRYPFRGIKLYLPGKENIEFFKRFIKDFAALYKFNKIVLELNANMRLDKHPELNIGAVAFTRYLNAARLDRPPGLHQEFQNSSHQDNADGQILEKDEVADIVRYIRKFNIEVIPELPSLTHAYYLLSGHRELAENLNQPYPDTYCPLKPEIYKIYFDVLDEYIAVIHPKMIHVGHDEWRVEKDICPLCRGRDYGELYANDLKTIHDYLAKKGIRIGIWGDHLLESVTQKDHQTWTSSTGYQYKIPGALRPEQVSTSIPKDILIFNWFWNDIRHDRQVSGFGFKQVYGNFSPDINRWDERDQTKGVMGGMPSSWAATTEYNFGKDQLYDFLAAADLLWSRHYIPIAKLATTIEPLIHGIYRNLSGKIFPSDYAASITPLDISASFNAALTSGPADLKGARLLTGDVKAGKQLFHLNAGGQDKKAIVADKQGTAPTEVVQINKDVSSILFLHAAAKEAANEKAFSLIYDFDDSAEPLGYYEIVYEDGMLLTIPIRYGVNILDWRWRQRMMNQEKGLKEFNENKYAWSATAVDCSEDKSQPVSFFSFEWTNPRYGKKIREIRLRSIDNENKKDNAVILLAVSISEDRILKKADGTEAQ